MRKREPQPIKKRLTSCRGRPPPCAHGSGPCGAQRSDQPSGRAPARKEGCGVSTKRAGRDGGGKQVHGRPP
eukprot:scaffold26062_cov66-Phaeocystis_antarctica.AAC.3